MTLFSKELRAYDEHLVLRNFSEATRRSYGSALRKFLQWRESRGFEGELDQSEVRQYLVERHKSGKSWQTINGDYSSLRKYFREVLELEWCLKKLPRPRKERSLPRILSIEEVHRLIVYCHNLKDQAFVCLLYGTGIRLGEALSLKLEHIDGNRNQLYIHKGKGSKDRYVDIPVCLLALLRHYYRQYRPETYLFNGRAYGEPLAPRSAQHLIQRNADRAGIRRDVSPHVLRHCYATHHLESGSDLVYLQRQLGHKHLKTTAKYIHLMKEHSWRINHPLASMEFEYSRRTQ